jgi:cytochrome c oxidase cbb3-type subunit 3
MAEGGKTAANAGARPAGVEVDPVTGQETTGHVWDGIRELNRPLPRWWLWTFYATIIWAAGYVVLYPAIPLIKGATAGVFGYSTRASVEDAMVQAREAQAGRLEKVATLPLEEIRTDADLNRFAVGGGRSAFLVNCVPCHGSGAAGSPGYANLNDDEWLWGGTLEEIYKTIAFGVRSGHPDARLSEMPNFGADQILPREDVTAAAEFVLSLSGANHDAVLAERGKVVFTENCAACHGDTGAGNREFGAPALNDAIWLYNGERATILAQISKPRHGVMPAWAGRLSDPVLKQLALYVYSLGGGEAPAN